jgi:hypothetical protein
MIFDDDVLELFKDEILESDIPEEEVQDEEKQIIDFIKIIFDDDVLELFKDEILESDIPEEDKTLSIGWSGECFTEPIIGCVQYLEFKQENITPLFQN